MLKQSGAGAVRTCAHESTHARTHKHTHTLLWMRRTRCTVKPRPCSAKMGLVPVGSGAWARATQAPACWTTMALAWGTACCCPSSTTGAAPSWTLPLGRPCSVGPGPFIRSHTSKSPHAQVTWSCLRSTRLAMSKTAASVLGWDGCAAAHPAMLQKYLDDCLLTPLQNK